MAEQLGIDKMIEALRAPYPIVARLDLSFDALRVCVQSNSQKLIDRLSDYFRRYLSTEQPPDLLVIALDAPEPELSLPFAEWERDPGKVGRKEQYADVEGGRVVRKVRTGMQFLLGRNVTLAIGRCLENDNQIINLINTRYIAEALVKGHLLCHAAAVARGKSGIALCGVSGAGKSTLALQLIGRGASFVSNDRLLLRPYSSGIEMSGVPKLPRVNPGTLASNEHLHVLLDPERRAQLAAMPLETLWSIEEKHDVDIERIFGPDRMQLTAQARALVMLTWQPGRDGPIEIKRSTLGERPDLIPLLAKHPGPFYRGPVALLERPRSVHALDPRPYLDALGDLPVVEIGGKANFLRAAILCEELLG